LQHDQAARLTWIQATSTGGVRARLRRVAGCATPSGSAGHAGETANFKLTFHLDHSAGADHRTDPETALACAHSNDSAHSFRRIASPRICGILVIGFPRLVMNRGCPSKSFGML